MLKKINTEIYNVINMSENYHAFYTPLNSEGHSSSSHFSRLASHPANSITEFSNTVVDVVVVEGLTVDCVIIESIFNYHDAQ